MRFFPRLRQFTRLLLFAVLLTACLPAPHPGRSHAGKFPRPPADQDHSPHLHSHRIAHPAPNLDS